jgi:hypothetical protein
MSRPHRAPGFTCREIKASGVPPSSDQRKNVESWRFRREICGKIVRSRQLSMAASESANFTIAVTRADAFHRNLAGAADLPQRSPR